MKRISRQGQSGYALILLVLALMGLGGVVLAGFTQDARQQTEHQRYLHNQRVLQEAKQALLQYAYNYPVDNPVRGPGRLPCPDMDNDGSPNSSFNCISGSAMVGRFPWNDDGMNFYDARDASGSRLWYAVSQNFANSISPPANDVINSDTKGTITVADVTGAVLHDATSTPSSGVVAVIIAPGPAIDRNGTRQDRSVSNSDDRFDTTADTDPGIVDPVNYLDIFGTVDNADFINGNANGFITGPIRNRTDGSLAVNDQVIVVTAAEVAAMAEKATLQAYRTAINDYLSGTGGFYPWLYNYEVNTIAELNGSFPAIKNFSTEISDKLDHYGRIPSMFAPYFRDGVDSEPIESKLSIDILNADFVGDIIYNRTFPSALSGTFTFVDTIWNGTPTADGPANMDISLETDEPMFDLRFENDVAPAPAPANVKLIGSIGADETYSIGQTFWFWSRKPPFATEWAKCESVHLVDCHVDAFYIPDPHGTGMGDIQILKVDVEFVFDSSVADAIEFALNVDNLPGTPPVITPADNNGHAQITAAFAAADVIASGSVIKIRWQYDDNYTDGNYDIDESGTLDFGSMAGATLQLGLRFYPELPRWAFDNGWHNAIRMAYADTYEPGTPSDCEPLPDGDSTNDCLSLPDEQGERRDIASLLVIAGEHGWVDDDADGMDDELRDVFDDGNQNNNRTFSTARGNDEILIIAEP